MLLWLLLRRIQLRMHLLLGELLPLLLLGNPAVAALIGSGGDVVDVVEHELVVVAVAKRLVVGRDGLGALVGILRRAGLAALHSVSRRTLAIFANFLPVLFKLSSPLHFLHFCPLVLKPHLYHSDTEASFLCEAFTDLKYTDF